MKKPLTRFLVFLFIVTLMPAQDAFAAWQIHYSGKAAKMFGYGGRGNFATKSQCESYRTSRPGFESMNSYCSGFDPPKPYRCPRAGLSAPFRAIERPRIRRAGTAAGPGGARGATSAGGSGRQTARAGCRHGTAAATLQQQQFDQGKSTLASDLRNRLNASGGTDWQSLSDCWAARAGQAAQRGDRASAKNYADYSIAAREGKSVPACQAAQSVAVPMPQGVAIVDDDKVRRMEEQMRIDPRIAGLYGKREEARATADKKKAEVENLEKTSRSTADPKAKQETDALAGRGEKSPCRGPGGRPQGHGGDQQGGKGMEGPQRGEGARRTGTARRIGRR